MSDVAPKSQRKSQIEEAQLANVVLRYFKLAGVAVGVWLSGYLNFSPSWILFGLILYVWKERQGQRKKLQIEIRQDTARDEQKAILARVEDLPSWVGNWYMVKLMLMRFLYLFTPTGWMLIDGIMFMEPCQRYILYLVLQFGLLFKPADDGCWWIIFNN